MPPQPLPTDKPHSPSEDNDLTSHAPGALSPVSNKCPDALSQFLACVGGLAVAAVLLYNYGFIWYT